MTSFGAIRRRRRLLLVAGSAAGLSSRSILAASRSLVTNSACALRVHEGLDLVLDLLELRRRLGALVLDLDDVPAELRLHRIGELALVELEGHLGEFRHHLVLGEIAEVAALRRGARVLRLLLGELGEVAALLELGDDRLGLVLGRHQDVAGAHLLLAAHLLDGVVIDLAHRLLGDRGLALRLQQRFHQQLVADEVEAVPAGAMLSPIGLATSP